MILVTGASGNVGGGLVKALLNKGVPSRAMVRDLAKVNLPNVVEVVIGNFDDQASLDAALKGVDQVFLMSPVRLLSDNTKAMVAAAKRAKVRHIVLLSSLSAELGQSDVRGKEHGDAEKAVQESGCEWTILRGGQFASNTVSWAPSIKTSRTVKSSLPNDPVALIDPVDIAAVAAVSMMEHGHHNKIYGLAGGVQTTPEECTRVLSNLLGVKLTFTEMTDLEAESWWCGIHGDNEEERNKIRSLRGRNLPWQPARPTVAEILGRRARTFEHWAAQNISAFTAETQEQRAMPQG